LSYAFSCLVVTLLPLPLLPLNLTCRPVVATDALSGTFDIILLYEIKLLHALGEEVAGPSGVQRASFVAGALRELSVGLCRGNFFMYRACLGKLANSSGTGFRAGMRVPTDEHWLL
jgi:hypothetical protein